MAGQSESECEISLGPGNPADTGSAYELLHMAGGEWQPLASELPTKDGAFPVSLAATPQQLFVLLGSHDKSGQRFRAAFRVSR
jgi:hypothetical protein